MSKRDGVQAAKVKSLWRYPVKSMWGESCDRLSLEEHGVAGDRAFGVLDLGSQTVISAKREGRLLGATSSLASGVLVVKLPDGREFGRGEALDEALSRWLERPVKLIDAASFGAATYESQEDDERDDSGSVQWKGPVGSFVDESPLHLLTTADLGLLTSERPDLQWDVHRFRPNVLIDVESESLGAMETGSRLQLGDVEVEIQKGCTRCVMTTRPQQGSLERELDVLRHVAKAHDSVVGVRARAVCTGVIRVGDPVHMLS
jgi:uncharacterized protein YcbX